MSLNYCSWPEGFTSGLQQWIPKKIFDRASDNLKKLYFFFYDEMKTLSRAHPVRAGCRILKKHQLKEISN
jgi:hypothetical protein